MGAPEHMFVTLLRNRGFSVIAHSGDRTLYHLYHDAHGVRATLTLGENPTVKLSISLCWGFLDYLTLGASRIPEPSFDLALLRMTRARRVFSTNASVLDLPEGF